MPKGMCDREGPCDMHRDIVTSEKCPDMCDFANCTNHASVDISYGDQDKAFCSFCAQGGLAIMLLSAQ